MIVHFTTFGAALAELSIVLNSQIGLKVQGNVVFFVGDT